MINLDIVTATCIIIVITSFVLAVAVFKQPKKTQNKMFFSAMSFLVSLWVADCILLHYGNVFDSVFYMELADILSVLIVTPLFFLFLLFALSFKTGKLEIKKKTFVVISILPAIIMFLVIVAPDLFYGKVTSVETGYVCDVETRFMFTVYNVYMLSYIISGSVIFIRLYRAAKEKIRKKQIKFILAGTFIPLINGIVIGGFGPMFFDQYTDFFWLAPTGIFILVASFYYSVTKHHLFNVKIIGTEIFTFLICSFLFIKIFTDESSTMKVVDIALFILVVISGVFLIRSVLREVSQKEKLATLTEDLSNANNELSDLNNNLEEKVKEQTKEVRKAYAVEKKARERLEMFDKIKSEFVSVAAHQLRTPLSGIRWSLGIVLDEKNKNLTTDQETFLNQADKATKNLINIVGDLLNVTKIESGEFGYSMGQNDLKKIINDSIDSSKILLEKKQINISFEDKAPELKPFVFDAIKIIMALKNIIINAIDYTKEGGKIMVVLSEESEDAVITITDNGIGMSDKERINLFTKFYRSSEARLMETDRSGLGLFVVKKIIDKHAGTINVESKKGKGTKVTVHLPIVQKAPFLDGKSEEK
ncbi:MAG: hypothetical protein KAS07_02625 [Candidatus Pacebacteria bacterium]|nr:hypothetical protein [Candidatus Paceibacterota bacterium]